MCLMLERCPRYLMLWRFWPKHYGENSLIILEVFIDRIYGKSISDSHSTDKKIYSRALDAVASAYIGIHSCQFVICRNDGGIRQEGELSFKSMNFASSEIPDNISCRIGPMRATCKLRSIWVRFSLIVGEGFFLLKTSDHMQVSTKTLNITIPFCLVIIGFVKIHSAKCVN